MTTGRINQVTTATATLLVAPRLRPVRSAAHRAKMIGSSRRREPTRALHSREGRGRRREIRVLDPWLVTVVKSIADNSTLVGGE